MLKTYFSRSLLETSSVFWKSRENFNLEEFMNPILVAYNLTENFIVDVAVEIFRNFSGRIYPSITININQFAGKKYRRSDFLKKQRE